MFARLYDEAIAAGHEVQLVAGFRTDRALLPEQCAAVDLRGRAGSAWVEMAKAVVNESRRFRPDVVLSNSIEVLVPGVPTVTIIHDLNFGGQGAGLGGTARRLFYRAQSRALTRVVAVSDVTKNALVGIGISPEKVVRIHNGVDLERFSPAAAPHSSGPTSPAAASSSLRPDASGASPGFRFVHVSRILPGKGQHASIDAFGRLRPDQRKGMALDIVGALADRLYGDQLRVQAHKLAVNFHFDVPDVVPYYQAADVALFPTLMPEGFGFAAIEAMACGVPVIHYAEPAVAEATGGHAIEVPRDDAAALRDAMLRLHAHPAERKELAVRGRAWVERYRWPAVWAAYDGVLAEAAARRPR